MLAQQLMLLLYPNFLVNDVLSIWRNIFQILTKKSYTLPKQLSYKHSSCIPRWNDVETVVSTSLQGGMLAEEDYLAETHTIQISTCHRFTSICFTERQILKEFCESEHLLPPDIYVKFEPDYYTKIRISIENIPKKQKHPPIKLCNQYWKNILPRNYTT